MITSAFEGQYVQIISLVFGFSCLVFGLFCLGTLLFSEKLELDSEKLVIKNIFNRTKREILLEEVDSYSLVIQNTKSSKEESLVIFFKGTKYEIPDTLFTYYWLLKEALTKGKARNDNYEKQSQLKSKKLLGLIYIVIGVFLIGIYFYSRTYGPNPNLYLVEIEGTVNSDLTINKRNYKHSSPYVNIRFKEYSDFTFEIRNVAYEATKVEYLRNEIKIGDRVKIEILEYDFDTKITKKKDLSFTDKSVNYHIIDVYSLTENGINFIDKELSANLFVKEKRHNFLFPLLFLALILYGVYIVVRKEE